MKVNTPQARTFLFLMALLCFRFETVEAVEIIANPSVHVASLTQSQLRRIFLLRQTQWPDKTKIKIFVLPDKSTTHIAFCKEVLVIFPYQLKRSWNKTAYSGLAEQPTKVESEDELIKLVQQTPGAIGYVEGTSDIEGLQYIQVASK